MDKDWVTRHSGSIGHSVPKALGRHGHSVARHSVAGHSVTRHSVATPVQGNTGGCWGKTVDAGENMRMQGTTAEYRGQLVDADGNWWIQGKTSGCR